MLDHCNWRVIERSGLTPIGQVKGRCSAVGIRRARAWFTQTVPYLFKYRYFRVKGNSGHSKAPQLNQQEGRNFDRDACRYPALVSLHSLKILKLLISSLVMPRRSRIMSLVPIVLQTSTSIDRCRPVLSYNEPMSKITA